MIWLPKNNQIELYFLKNEKPEFILKGRTLVRLSTGLKEPKTL